jgi:hypothetical protein
MARPFRFPPVTAEKEAFNAGVRKKKPKRIALAEAAEEKPVWCASMDK